MSIVFYSIIEDSNANLAEDLYALINPPTPNFVPPKYRTETTRIFVNSKD